MYSRFSSLDDILNKKQKVRSFRQGKKLYFVTKNVSNTDVKIKFLPRLAFSEELEAVRFKKIARREHFRLKELVKQRFDRKLLFLQAYILPKLRIFLLHTVLEDNKTIIMLLQLYNTIQSKVFLQMQEVTSSING